MVARGSGAGGHEGAIRGREISDIVQTVAAELSVQYGTMVGMHATPHPEPPQPPAYAERVLDVTEQIPPGRVLTYGDIAEWLGEGGPRQVGRVMALYGAAVPWWRVVRADGALLPGHEQRAMRRYRAEGTPLREAGPAAGGHISRIDMRRARWDGGGN